MPFQAFGSIKARAGEIEVIANTYVGNGVTIRIDGALDVRLPITAEQARALAAQLIAAADYAEGKA